MFRHVFFVAAALILGCGSLGQSTDYPVYPTAQLPQVANSSAYILLGVTVDAKNEEIAKICTDFATDPIIGILLMGYAGGNRIAPAGVILPTHTAQTVPRFWAGGSSVYNDASFVRADEKGHAYVVFEVPATYFTNRPNTIVFSGVYKTPSDLFGKFTLRQWPATSTPEPVDANAFYPGQSTAEAATGIFTGWSFPITGPGVYYLGELIVAGTILSKNSPHNEAGTAFLGEAESVYIVSQKAGSMVDDAKQTLAASWLKDLPLIDFSNRFQSIPVADFPYYMSGKK